MIPSPGQGLGVNGQLEEKKGVRKMVVQKWEYKVVPLMVGGHRSPDRTDQWEGALNSFGDEGWELVNIVTVQYPRRTQAIFKRNWRLML